VFEVQNFTRVSREKMVLHPIAEGPTPAPLRYNSPTRGVLATSFLERSRTFHLELSARSPSLLISVLQFSFSHVFPHSVWPLASIPPHKVSFPLLVRETAREHPP